MRLALGCLAVLLCACPPKKVDLSRGGVEFVYRLDSPSASVEEAGRVVTARLKGAKVPAEVLVEGAKLKVRLPPMDADAVQDLKALVSAPAHLEFREVDDGTWLAALEGKEPEGVSVKATPGRDGAPQRTVLAKAAPPAPPAGLSWTHGERQPDGVTEYTPLKGQGLDNAAIASAETSQGQQMHDWQVRLAFTPEGKQQFAELTERLVNKKLAIVLDGRLLMAPVVMERIAGGTAMVTLGRSGSPASQEQEARRLAIALSASPLPAPLIAESEQLIPPAH